MTDLPTLGSRVRDLRADAGLTYRALGDRLGVHWTLLSHVEHDRRPVQLSADKLAQLGRILGTDPDELVALAGKLPPDIAAALRDPENMHKVRQCLGL